MRCVLIMAQISIPNSVVIISEENTVPKSQSSPQASWEASRGLK
jgi:hypothetical protein